jgi:hypothetical protein
MAGIPEPGLYQFRLGGIVFQNCYTHGCLLMELSIIN